MKAKYSLPEERKRMFSSKIIKIDDEQDNGPIRSFFLQQFPSEEDKAVEKKAAAEQQHSVKSTLDAAKIQAEKIRVQAHQSSKKNLEQSRKKAKQIEKDAYRTGYDEGLAAGMAKGEKEFEEKKAALASIAEEFLKLKEGFYQQHQDIVIDLALKIAEKVIHHEVSANKQTILSVLQSAIRLAVEREKLHIRINPEDMDVCLQSRNELLKTIDGVKQIVFEGDETVGRGGALIEYAFGEIDARLDRQLAEVEENLKSSHFDMEQAV